MSGMADGDLAGGLWNWSAAGRVDEAEVRSAVAGALGRPVTGLDENTADNALLCNVWYVGGEFPTLIDCYLAPGIDEAAIASAVAVRLGAAVLLDPACAVAPERDAA